MRWDVGARGALGLVMSPTGERRGFEMWGFRAVEERKSAYGVRRRNCIVVSTRPLMASQKKRLTLTTTQERKGRFDPKKASIALRS